MDCYWINDSIKDKKVEYFYDIGHEIGRSRFQIEGALSVVSACYDRRTKHSYAVNVMKKKVGYCPKNADIAIFLKLDHANVMRVREVFETLCHIYVVREHIMGKALFRHFKEAGVYNEHKVGQYIKQILLGLRYLHEHQIIHGNIKSENLIVKDIGDQNYVVKICDHIQSTILHYDIYRLAIIALPSLCPPEVLLSQIRTYALDMWSVGIVTFILLCGYEPFYKVNETELFRAVLTSNYQFNTNCDVISNASKDFIIHLLVSETFKRLTIIDALKHPWFEICEMKNQELGAIYQDFVQCTESIEDRMETKVMDEIRRACNIFEKLVLRNSYRVYTK